MAKIVGNVLQINRTSGAVKSLKAAIKAAAKSARGPAIVHRQERTIEGINQDTGRPVTIKKVKIRRRPV